MITFVSGSIISTRDVGVGTVVLFLTGFLFWNFRINIRILLPFLRAFLWPFIIVDRATILRRFRETFRILGFLFTCLRRNLLKLQCLKGLIIHRGSTVPIIVLSFERRFLSINEYRILFSQVGGFYNQVYLTRAIHGLICINFRTSGRQLLYRTRALRFVDHRARCRYFTYASFIPTCTATVLLGRPSYVLL